MNGIEYKRGRTDLRDPHISLNSVEQSEKGVIDETTNY